MEKLKIVSFNLRFPNDADGINRFISRAGGIVKKINEEKPDVIGFQEGWEESINFLKPSLPDYDIFYNQRNADFGGEGLALAVRKDTFSLLTLDFFWLSETPYKPGSRYKIQSNCPRICQTALLIRKSDKQLVWVYNNHLDHESDSARILGIAQVLGQVAENSEKFDAPIFILGDFNATPDSETLKFCYDFKNPDIVDLTAESGTTFHGFAETFDAPKFQNTADSAAGFKIDYIFTDKATAQKPFTLKKWTDERSGIFLSDHYPLCVEIEI